MAGRKTTTSAETIGPVFVGATPADMATQESRVNQALELAGGMSDERDLMNQLLGQVQMAGAFEQFSRTVRTSKLLYVKENKLYRALKGKKTPNGSEILAGTWEEFCSLLGSSADKADIDIANLRAFGEEALESMSRMGIGYRELRQYRSLPQDERLALIEVAKAGDKEALLDIAESLIEKHAREKIEVAKKMADTQADLEASRRRVAEQAETIQQKESALIKLTAGTLPWDERVKPFEESLTKRSKAILPNLHETVESIKALDQWFTDHVTSQPDYNPEVVVEPPKEVNLLLIQLNETINSAADQIAIARHELETRFGIELAAAKRYILQPQQGE